MTGRYISSSAEETAAAGERLGARMAERGGPTVVALYGGLGAGKTAFVAGMARGLGCVCAVTSPSYTLVNEYPGRDGSTVLCHFDLYRIGGEELDGIGWDDYLDRGLPIAVEWAERAEGLLPRGTLSVYIRPFGDGKREIVMAGISDIQPPAQV